MNRPTARATFRHISRGWSLAGRCILLLLIAVSGCDRMRTPHVAGKVTVDGAPVATGKITFTPLTQGDDEVEASSEIRNGGFSLNCPAGQRRVSIFAFRPAGTPGPDGKPHMEQYIPKTYNLESTQVVEIVGPEMQNLNFDLSLPTAAR